MPLAEEQLDARQSFEPNYELSGEDVREMTEKLLSNAPEEVLNQEGPFVCAELSPDSEFANLGRWVEEKVFVEEFDNKPEEMVKEYGPYEAASRFWIILDKEKKMPAGALRAIEDSSNGFKTLNDIALPKYLGLPTAEVRAAYGMDFAKTWDVGTVAVLPEYRGTNYEFMPSLSLYRALYARALDENIEHFVSVIDKKARSNLDLLGIPFTPIMDSEDFFYLGSEHSWALHGYVNNFYPEVTARQQQLDPSKGIGALIYKSMDIIAHGTDADQRRFIAP